MYHAPDCDTLHSHVGVICIAIGTGFLATTAVLILVFRNSIGYLFVDSADVAAVVASIDCPDVSV
jgi:Na+-driven multidrug efflux pump